MIELIVAIAILAILASISMTAYIKFRTKSMVSSYALPIARACMMDIASHCASETPVSGTETYSSPIGDPRFFNCRSLTATAVGNVVMEVDQVPICNSSGMLSQGRIVAYMQGSPNSYRVFCEADVRPFRCYIE